MAPAVTIDNTPDFEMPTTASKSGRRTLLLAPPSVSAHPETLARVAEAYDRNATDIQMLDRLASAEGAKAAISLAIRLRSGYLFHSSSRSVAHLVVVSDTKQLMITQRRRKNLIF